MRVLTEAEILERGIAAQTLLNDPTFQNVFQELSTALAVDAFETDPKDWKTREMNYQTVRGLKLMIGMLNERRAIAVELQAQIEARDEAGVSEQSEEP